MTQYVTPGTPLYDLGVGADGQTRKSPRLTRSTCAALLADTNLGVSVVLAEGAVVTAGGHRYEVCAAGATDQHLTTAGGVKLKAIARDGAINLEALGAPGDATTDISTLIETAMAMDADIIFPRRVAISRSIRFKGTARRFIFPNSAVALLPGGAFDDVITHGSGVDTGFDVVFNLGTSEAGCKRCVFDGCVSVGSAANTSGATNLVLWAASELSATHTNSFRVKTYVGSTSFKYAFLGQGTTVATAGSLTGSTIAYIETGNGIGAFSLAPNQDDIKIAVIRDRGKSALSTDLIVDEYYMYGTDTTGATDGVSLGSFATLEVGHHFIEGTFRYPVLLNGDNNQYLANVRVSNNFASASGQVVTCNTNDCHVRIAEEVKGRQGAHSCYIRRSPSAGYQGLFEVTLTTTPDQPDYKAAIVYGNTVDTGDIVQVRDASRAYRGRFAGALKYREIDPHSLAILDETGANVGGMVQPRGAMSLGVSNNGRYALYNRPADFIGLTAASAVTVLLYKSIVAQPSLVMTLVADGAGDVTLTSDATGPIIFAAGETSYRLLAGRANSITLRWLAPLSSWIEIGRLERPSLYAEASATDIASAGSTLNTVGKRKGLLVWDTTNKRMLRASGPNATSTWEVVDGSASVTPA